MGRSGAGQFLGEALATTRRGAGRRLRYSGPVRLAFVVFGSGLAWLLLLQAIWGFLH